MTHVHIERQLFIEARPSTIFSYFTDASKLRLWLGQQAQLDPVEGGRLQIDMNSQDIVLGAFRSIEPFERIVFTWGWRGSDSHPPGSSVVEVTLKPEANGTWLHLRHASVPESEQECHLDGWVRNMERLRAAVSNEASIGSGV